MNPETFVLSWINKVLYLTPYGDIFYSRRSIINLFAPILLFTSYMSIEFLRYFNFLGTINLDGDFYFFESDFEAIVVYV